MKSLVILVMLSCMILPVGAAVDGVPSVPDAGSAPVAKFYSFDRVGEPDLIDSGSGLLNRMPDSKHWTKTVSIEIKDMTLGDAVKTLLKDTDIKFGIDPKVMPLKVTAMLKNVPLQSALLEILKAAGAIAATREDGVMYITPIQPYSNMAFELQRKIAEMAAELAMERTNKSEDHPSVKALQNAIEALEKRLGQEWDHVPQMGPPGSPTWYFANPSAPGKGSKTRIFVIEYINPAEMVPMLYAVGARQVTTIGENRLVVAGEQDAIERAEEIIADMDREESLPRPVRLLLTVKIRSEQKGVEPFDCAVSADGAGAEGRPVQPNLRVKLPMGQTDDTAEVLLTSEVTPTITPDGKIALRGSGSFKFTTSVEAARTFEFAIVVEPEKSYVVSEGSTDVAPGKVSFSVEVVATIGEGRLRTRTKGGFGGGGGGGSLISPGLGGYRGMGGFGGDSECFDPTQWSAAFDACGQNMAQFGVAMEAAAAQWQKAFDGFGGLGGDTGGYGGQDDDTPDCPSGVGVF